MSPAYNVSHTNHATACMQLRAAYSTPCNPENTSECGFESGSLTVTSEGATLSPPIQICKDSGGGTWDKCGSVTVKVIKVIIKQGDNDITGQTQDTIVGRNIGLTGVVLPEGTSVTAHQWVIPEKRIENYTADVNSAAVNALEGAELQNQSVSYYWVDGGDGRQVTYTATVGGQQSSANTTFNVKRPTSTITCTTGSVAADQDYGFSAGWWLHFGKKTTVGIYFDTSVTEPPGFTGGDTCWFQTTSSYTRRYQLNNGDWYKKQNSGTIYDDGPGGTFPVPKNFAPPDTEDSPGTSLAQQIKRKTASESYSMYFMYKPTGTAIWVPLRKVDWSWSGDATRNGQNWNLDSSNHSANPASADCTSHPTWNGKIGDLVYVKEE